MDATLIIPLISGLTKSVLLMLYSNGLAEAFPAAGRNRLRLWLLSVLIIILSGQLVFALPIRTMSGLTLATGIISYGLFSDDGIFRLSGILAVFFISAGAIALLRGQQVLFLVLYFCGYFSIKNLFRGFGSEFNKEAGHGE